MTTADPVAEALDTVLGEKESGVATTDEPTPEVKPDEVPSDEKAPGTTEKVTDPKAGAGKDPVPYDRFSEVVKAKNDALAKVESLEGQFDGAKSREDTLRTRVGELENSHQLLDAIKQLANDERYRDHVVAIDKALQGIEEEVEEAKETGDDSALKAAQKQLASKTSEFEDLVSHQKAEVLYDLTDKMASQMLDALPEEYNDEDKEILSKLWTPTVNWDVIEKTGREAIQPELQSSFAELIKDYKTPRGALIKTTQQEAERENPETKAVSTEDAIKAVLEKDYSAVDKDGKIVHSEDDFSKDMAEVMRLTRRQ